ncbi:unnamed protein product, partial [Symbiodinium sp. CCMP2592]
MASSHEMETDPLQISSTSASDEAAAAVQAPDVQQQAQDQVQAIAANMSNQAQTRVQAIEQQAQAMVSEVSVEASRQLAVANETIASLKQQNEMLARQQQELYSQIATLQSIVAEVKATSKGIGIGAGFAPAITPIAGPPGPPPPPEPEIFDIGDPEEGEEEQVDDDPIVEPRAVGNNDRGFDGGADAQPHDENEEEDYEAATYKYKDLQDLKMPQLPKDNVGFRSWRNALLTQYSAIDRTGQARRTFGWLWEQFSDHLAELREDANERQDANAKAKSIATAVPAKDTAVPAAPGKPPKGRLLHLPPLFVLTFLRLHMKLGRSLTSFESLRAQGVYTDDLVCHEDEPVSFET